MAPPIKDVTVAKFAELRGVTSQRVYQLIQEGLPHRKRGNTTRIIPHVAIAWLIKRAAEEAKGGDLNEARERARKTRAEADMKEMDREERRRSLVPAKISTEYIEAFVGGLASVAAGQLGRFERDIVKAETPAEARAVRMNIHRALMEGAQRYADDLAQRAEALELELSGEAIDAPAA